MMHPALMMLLLHITILTIALLCIARYVSMAAVGFLLSVQLKGTFA
jgi:hypothetical protein